MKNDDIHCSDCGEWYDRHCDNHDCSGSPDERLYELEKAISRLQSENADLRDTLTRYDARLEAIEITSTDTADRRVIVGVVGFDSDVGYFVDAGNGHVTVPHPFKPGDKVRVTIERVP